MDRVSSTPLAKHMQCPRANWYERGELIVQDPVVTNAVMAFGTIFHAFMEFRGHKGRWPTRSEFDEMKGSYDDPITAARRFPEQYEPALRSAQHVFSVRPDLATFDDDVEFEKPLDDFGLSFGHVTASGYIDVFLPSRRTIRDYKTRSSFTYCPRTLEDFMKDPQQAYYGAAVARAMGWDEIRVEHVNILRPDKGGPDVFQIGVTLPRDFLDEVWADLETRVIPDMVRLIETVDDERDVPVDRGTCWRYGKCRHYSRCGKTHEEAAEDPFAFFNDAVAKSSDPFDGVF